MPSSAQVSSSMLQSEFTTVRRSRCNDDNERLNIHNDSSLSSSSSTRKKLPVFPPLLPLGSSSSAPTLSSSSSNTPAVKKVGVPPSFSSLPYRSTTTNLKLAVPIVRLAMNSNNNTRSSTTTGGDHDDHDDQEEEDELHEYFQGLSPLSSRSVGTMTREYDRVTARMKRRIDASRVLTLAAASVLSSTGGGDAPNHGHGQQHQQQHLEEKESEGGLTTVTPPTFEYEYLPLKFDGDEPYYHHPDNHDENNEEERSQSADSEEFFDLDM